MKKLTSLIIAIGLVASCQVQSPTTPLEPHSAVPTLTKMIFTPTTLPPSMSITVPTLTPLPTLSPEGTIVLMQQLVQDNGTCRLPCLLGLTPGTTTPSELYQFLEQFRNYDIQGEIYVDVRQWLDEGMGGFSFNYNEEQLILGTGFSYYLDSEQSEVNLLHIRAGALYDYGLTSDGLRDIRPIDGDDERFHRLMRQYLLPQILTNYGIPEQVWIAAFPDLLDRPDIQKQNFSVMLFYWSQGFLVEYVSLRETMGENYAFCPSKARISLVTWGTGNPPTLEYISRIAGDEMNELNISYFKPLSDVTHWSEQEFYETFRETSYETCLLTPTDLWPAIP